MTNNLLRRVWEHRENVLDGFTKRHNVHRLVYFEGVDCPEAAIQREKSLKKWPRDWKINLIEEQNPEWFDLYPGLSQ